MKQLSLFLVLAIVSICLAAALTAPTDYGPLFWECDTAYNTSGDDTLSGDDSVTIFTKYRFEPGWKYALKTKFQMLDSVTIKWEEVLYGSDESTEFETIPNDTITGDSATYTEKTSVLAIGRTGLANYATVRCINLQADSTAVLSRVELWRARLNQSDLKQ